MYKFVDKNGYSNFKDIRAHNAHFKLCKKCRSFNYYKNKECVLCKEENLDMDFSYDISSFKEIIKEYEFYQDKGFVEAEIDKLLLSTVPIDNIRCKDKNFKLNKKLSKLKTTSL